MNFENRRDSDWICLQYGHHPKATARAPMVDQKIPTLMPLTVNRAFPVGIPAKAAKAPGVHVNPKTLTKPLDNSHTNV